MTAMHARRPSSLIPFALTFDDAAAQHWLEALERAGIPAEIHIEDGTRLAAGSSMFPTGRIFASAIYIASDSRERAAALLIDLGWDGRQLGGGHRGRSLDERIVAGAAIGLSLLGLGLVLLLRGM